MEPKIKKDKTPFEVAENIANAIKKIVDENSAKNKKTNIAISGGSTPKILFKILSEEYTEKMKWDRLNIYWVDERCVPPTSEDSNYGMTKKYLLDKIEIPDENIHRIVGENTPDKEAARYEREIDENVLIGEKGVPVFDLILLGIGTDGHTASIFPGYLKLFNEEKLCAVTEHPDSVQKRITITGKIINNSKKVIFMITGKDKSEVVKKIINKEDDYKNYPAAFVDLESGNYEWYLDSAAAKNL
ncbi:MAG TPA: 6-phosphogluconolactonase [Ignavibacteriaceae bacterium]|nr:6-phosphogluconolactonase [Ignavibacteriaceae bacterium]